MPGWEGPDELSWATREKGGITRRQKAKGKRQRAKANGLFPFALFGSGRIAAAACGTGRQRVCAVGKSPHRTSQTACGSLSLPSGEGGIRTRGELLAHTAFPVLHLR